MLDCGYIWKKKANCLTLAMRPNEVSQKLKLDDVARNHVWKVEPSCATTGEGIFEGLVSLYYLFPVMLCSCLLILILRLGCPTTLKSLPDDQL
jgi:hypothetical protein